MRAGGNNHKTSEVRKITSTFAPALLLSPPHGSPRIFVRLCAMQPYSPFSYPSSTYSLLSSSPGFGTSSNPVGGSLLLSKPRPGTIYSDNYPPSVGKYNWLEGEFNGNEFMSPAGHELMSQMPARWRRRLLIRSRRLPS